MTKKQRDHRPQKNTVQSVQTNTQAISVIPASVALPMIGQQDKSCGECQACCEVVGVDELNKDTYTRCQHQCQAGCAIYGQHPSSCKTYFCLWKAGFINDLFRRVGLDGADDFRPDKCGVILDSGSTHKYVFQGWEVWEGAADQPHVRKMLEALSKMFVLYIRRYKSGRRLILGPEEMVRDIMTGQIKEGGA